MVSEQAVNYLALQQARFMPNLYHTPREEQRNMSSSSLVLDPNTLEKPSSTTPSGEDMIPPKAKPWGGTTAWGKPSPPTKCSLNDVMSEQLAQQLDTDQKVDASLIYEAQDAELALRDEPDTSDDLLIAQMIQHEFDKEFDHDIKLRENKFNADSKVRLTYDNYRSVHPSLWDEDNNAEEVMEKEEVKEQQRNFRGRGISGKGKDIVTKHDAGINQRRNASKAMEQFAPEVNVGDGLDMKLSNKVFNSLKQHSQAEAKRAHRLHEKKDHSTAEHSLDTRTRLELYKFVNNGLLEDVNGIISTGKESVVFHATAGSDAVTPLNRDGTKFATLPPEIAIKVFKTTLSDFKNRADYVKGDVRFFKDEFKKQNPRKIMRLWADKESINLRRMARFGIPCPRVVHLRKHILLMEFLGRDRKAALKLKDARLSEAEAQLAYDQVIEYTRRMYRECYLVHGDLSEYNLLWHDDMVYMIDVSQAVDRLHPHAHEFLLRDCRNMSRFFKRLNVHDVMDEYTLFNYVTGLDFSGSGKVFLMQMQEYEKNENQLRLGSSKKNYNFDFFFDKSTKERKEKESNIEEKNTENTENTKPAENICTTESIDERLRPDTEEADVKPASRTEADVKPSGKPGKRRVNFAEAAYSSDEEASEEEQAVLFEKFIAERRAELDLESVVEDSVSLNEIDISEKDSRTDGST